MWHLIFVRLQRLPEQWFGRTNVLCVTKTSWWSGKVSHFYSSYHNIIREKLEAMVCPVCAVVLCCCAVLGAVAGGSWWFSKDSAPSQHCWEGAESNPNIQTGRQVDPGTKTQIPKNSSKVSSKSFCQLKTPFFCWIFQSFLQLSILKWCAEFFFPKKSFCQRRKWWKSLPAPLQGAMLGLFFETRSRGSTSGTLGEKHAERLDRRRPKVGALAMRWK